MSRGFPDEVASALKECGLGKDAVWDCHGTWVIYHRALERVAASKNITFDQPVILDVDSAAKSVAICVTGRMGERSEWSIGEASPANNKNAYPFAMAEKRAKDRVILKLVGLHGLVYSEEEADTFKDATPRIIAAEKPKTASIPEGDNQPAPSLAIPLIPGPKAAVDWEMAVRKAIDECGDVDTLAKIQTDNGELLQRYKAKYKPAGEALMKRFIERMGELQQGPM